VYAVVDTTLSPTFPLGDALEVYVRRDDAERFIDEVRGDDPKLARDMRMEEAGASRGRLRLRSQRALGERGLESPS
jgi:hypothetical protein